MRQLQIAGEALRLATIAPEQARVLATRTVQAGRREKDWEAVSTAMRALGVAAFQLRDLDASKTWLRASIAIAQRAQSPRLAAESRMSLAATLTMSGAGTRAITTINAALADLTGVAAARARVQRAGVFQVLGRNNEGLAELRVALPMLRRAGDFEWETRALSNRSLLLTAQRSFAAAEADLVAARELCEHNGLALAAGYAEQNLGCLRADQGKVLAALDSFDRADGIYQRLGMVVGTLLIDRARLLLSVRLTDEALTTAELAVSTLTDQKRRLQVPEAQLLLSTVALVQGDADLAVASANAAGRGFRRLGRPDGIVLAQYARLQAMTVNRREAVSPLRARRCADQLASMGWTVPALEARLLAGRIALQRGWTSEARADFALASRARFTGPAEVRVRAWLGEALLRRSDGHRRSASVALRTALRIVERYQATLGATELRANVSAHRGAVARLGLQMALEDRNGRRTLAWAERGRASALLMRPPEPPADPILAAELADLRMTMVDLEDRLHHGKPTADLVQHQIRLEHAIADRTRKLPPRTAGGTGRVREIADVITALGPHALVEYIELDGFLHAVTVVDGIVRLHSLGPLSAVAVQLEHLSFALRRLVNPQLSPLRTRAAETAVGGVIGEFEALLFARIRPLLGDRELVIVPTGALQSLPWSILPTCAGRPVTIAPSATLWLNAAEHPRPARSEPVVLVAGPGLPGANAEITALGEVHPRAQKLTGSAATAPAFNVAVDGAALVHIAAHGRLRSDNPFFSSLLLFDGPLTVFDLERLARAPHHVVLAACDTARPHVIAGQEVIGLAAALLGQGTTSLVAPLFPIPDAASVPLMRAYHGGLAQGMTPATALAVAQAEQQDGPAAGRATAAAFVCMGDGLGAAFRPESAVAPRLAELAAHGSGIH